MINKRLGVMDLKIGVEFVTACFEFFATLCVT